MFFSTSGSSAIAAQTLEDIDKTLDATLDICNSNKDLLTDAERTNFLNNHTRLSDVRAQLTDSTKCSKLSKTLDKCESLKMEVNSTCLKHREKEIRKILARSLASASSAPLVAVSKPTPSVTAPTVLSLTQQSARDSSHTLTHRVQDVNHSTFIRKRFSNVSIMRPPEIPTQSIAEDISRAISNAIATLAVKPQARNFESECMIFNGNSVVGSPTMNIDSPNAVGSTNIYDGARPVQNSQSHIPVVENQRLPRTPTWRERCMTFEGGIVDDPTLNIRSPGASGAFTRIIPRPEELTT